MTEPKPKQCIVDPRRGLMYLKWQNDHESLIPLTTVRQLCPCVQCQEQREAATHDDPLRVLSPSVANMSVEPVAVEPQGNYALLIRWSDGHATGIYTWGYLRAMCPCAECQARPPQ